MKQRVHDYMGRKNIKYCWLAVEPNRDFCSIADRAISTEKAAVVDQMHKIKSLLFYSIREKPSNSPDQGAHRAGNTPNRVCWSLRIGTQSVEVLGLDVDLTREHIKQLIWLLDLLYVISLFSHSHFYHYFMPYLRSYLSCAWQVGFVVILCLWSFFFFFCIEMKVLPIVCSLDYWLIWLFKFSLGDNAILIFLRQEALNHMRISTWGRSMWKMLHLLISCCMKIHLHQEGTSVLKL